MIHVQHDSLTTISISLKTRSSDVAEKPRDALCH